MSTQQEQFQMIINKQDYDQLKQIKINYQKLLNKQKIANQQIQFLTKNIQQYKKSVYRKSQEVQFLVNEIKFFCNEIMEISKADLEDLNKSYYQQLVEQGVSAIEQMKLLKSFQQNHFDVITMIRKVQVKFLNLNNEIKQAKSITIDSEKNTRQSKTKSILDKILKEGDSKGIDKQILSDLIKEKNIVDNKMRVMKKQLEETIEKNHKLQREIYEIKQNKNKQPKIYQIKQMIDNYYEQLEISLAKEKFDPKQVDTIIESQLKGITQYTQKLTRQRRFPIIKKR